VVVAETEQDFYSFQEIDLVYVATPPATHASHVRAAQHAGWKVFCEKPLGVDLEDSQQLVHESQGFFQAVNFVYSGAPNALEVERALGQGELGNVSGASIHLQFSQWPRAFQGHAGWLAGREQGGFMREVGSHFLYLCQRLFGPLALHGAPIVIEGQQSEDYVSAVWYAGEQYISLEGRVGGMGSDRAQMTILGDRKSLRIDHWYGLYQTTEDGWAPLFDEQQSQPRTAYANQLNLLSQQLIDGKKRLADFSEALHVQRLVEEVLQSSRRG
jgi:predicted dehydrogenase